MAVRIPKALKAKLAAKAKPKPNRCQMILRVDPALRAEFKAMCALQARDMQDVISDLMAEEIRRDRLLREKAQKRGSRVSAAPV